MRDARGTRPLLYALFFLSGTAGLIYQIVWTRMLVLVFGNTILAMATVLSAFMGGLAAGSFALGLFVDRRPRRLIRLYAGLEAGIGLFAVAFPFLLEALTPIYAVLFRALREDVVALNLIRFLVTFALISVPTFLMGGTLPVLVKRFTGGAGSVGGQTGYLYGINTAGAVVGTVACGYVLLETLGMRWTTGVAIALNLGVALVSWGLSKSPAFEAPRPGDAPLPEQSGDLPAPTTPVGATTRRMVLVGIGLSGFCALAYEVFWTRMLNLFLHNTIYSFTAILATFLVGIALGSLLYSRFLASVPDQVPIFVALEVAIGLAAYATPFLFGLLHGALFDDLSQSLTLAKTMVVMLPPTVLMGIALPMAVQICHRGRHREGTTLGIVYATNTVGSILGAFLAGFVLLPNLGLQNGIILLAGLNVLAGALPALSRSAGRGRFIRAVVTAGIVAALVALAPPHLFRGLFERSHPSAELLLYQEGRVANVVVYDFQVDGYKDFHLNAVEEASSRLWHVQLFKLLGLLPPLLHEDPDEALMIAFGAGMSAGACVQRVERLDCVDLNPDIEGVGEIFRRENLDVLHSPRFNKVVNDGRNALLMSRKTYPLIISDATNPKMFDSWTLYSREFYELVESRLEPGGIFAQWVLIPLPADSLQVILRTFRQVFPHASLWCIYGSSQCLMLATPQRLEIDFSTFEADVEPILGSSGLREFGVDSTAKLLSFFLIGEDGLSRYLEGSTKINTDDLPFAQFQVEQDRRGVEAAIDLVRHRESVLRYLALPASEDSSVEETMTTLDEIGRRLHLGFLTASATRYREAELIAGLAGRVDANVQSMLHYGPEQQRYFEARVAEAPGDANAHNTLGYVYWQLGELAAAERQLREAVAIAPDFALARANLARLAVDREHLDQATAALLELRQRNPTKRTLEMTLRQLERVHLSRQLRYRPGDSTLLRGLARSFYREGRLLEAVRRYETALERDPYDIGALRELAEILERHRLPKRARAVYRRLSDLRPGDPRLRSSLAELEEITASETRLRAWIDRRGEREGDPTSAAAEHPPTCDRALEAWHDHDREGSIDRTALARAASLYEASIRERPDDLHAYVDAATLHELLGDDRRAIELWRGALELRPEWKLPALQIEILDLRRQLETVAEGSPARTTVLVGIAQRLFEIGYYETAREELEKAVAASPTRAEAWFELARVREAIGDYPAALEAAERCLSLDPGNGAAARIRERALPLLRQRAESTASPLATQSGAGASPPRLEAAAGENPS